MAKIKEDEFVEQFVFARLIVVQIALGIRQFKPFKNRTVRGSK
jgi:hypothetical protein